jgi:xanthine dehydrogenase accessory factor
MTDDDPLATALAWADAGRRVSLATVLQTWGSSPRPAGSQLAIRDDGLFVGSVSGGCVEGKVVEAALAGGEPRVLKFGVSDEEAWGVGLACGGTVRIRVGGVDRAALAALQAHREAKRAVALVTRLDTGAQQAVPRGDAHPLADAIATALRLDEAAVVDEAWLIVPYNPPLRLVVIGAVHIAQALAPMAALAGWEVTVVDPRSSFARPERFPGVRLVDEWPDDGLRALGIDGRTAVVTLTHDRKLDDPALQVALRSDALYVGALGSSKTQAARRRRLLEAGLDEAAVDRLRGPVGLPIGARTPAEIAVSILAQLTQDLRMPR